MKGLVLAGECVRREVCSGIAVDIIEVYSSKKGSVGLLSVRLIDVWVFDALAGDIDGVASFLDLKRAALGFAGYARRLEATGVLGALV